MKSILKIIGLYICAHSLAAAGASTTILCTDASATVRLTATIDSQFQWSDFELKEDQGGAAYGSRDKLLDGKLRDKYIRFTPYGSTNSEYRFSVPENFQQRKRFPIFLDTWFEGDSYWWTRVTWCDFQ